MRGEQGQITLFFIVGVVLLFTVALFYLLSTRHQAQQTVDTTDPQLNSYLSSCLDTAAENEFLDLGEHAGIADSVRSNFRADTYVYGVTKKQDGLIGPFVHPAPQYPNWSIRVSNTEFNDDGTTPLYNYQDGYFGTVQFIAPCSKESDNAPGSTFSCRYYPGLPAGTPVAKSTQELAQDDLAVKAKGCVNQELFQRTLGANVQVSDPTVKLTFTPQVILADAEFPLIVNGQAHQLRLQRTYQLRYRAIAEFAYDLARKETRDVHFIIEDPAYYKQLTSYREGFTVRRIKGTGADHIVINDSASLVHSQPYAFQFLVEHRAPMIDPSAISCDPALMADPDDMELQCSMVGGNIYIQKKDEPQLRDCLKPGTTEMISCAT